jgi:hypothetical protein
MLFIPNPIKHALPKLRESIIQLLQDQRGACRSCFAAPAGSIILSQIRLILSPCLKCKRVVAD